MTIDVELLSQFIVPHLIIMGAITFLAADQPGKFSRAEIIALTLGWLIPILGPIPAGLFVIINRRRQSRQDSS